MIFCEILLFIVTESRILYDLRVSFYFFISVLVYFRSVALVVLLFYLYIFFLFRFRCRALFVSGRWRWMVGGNDGSLTR